LLVDLCDACVDGIEPGHIGCLGLSIPLVRCLRHGSSARAISLLPVCDEVLTFPHDDCKSRITFGPTHGHLRQ